MNTIATRAAQALLQARHRRAAREARSLFLQHYDPQQAQQLLDVLHNAWHLGHNLDDDEALQRIYGFYKHLSLLLAAEYVLLQEGKRWQF